MFRVLGIDVYMGMNIYFMCMAAGSHIVGVQLRPDTLDLQHVAVGHLKRLS